jgi:hypothetical protein
MIRFTIITAIAQDLIKGHPPVGLGQDPGPSVEVIAGPLANQTRSNQMGPRVTEDRQLGPEPPMIGVSLGAADEVGAGMAGLQTGRIHRPLGGLAQQTQDAGSPKDGVKQAVKSLFFPSRFSA